MPTLHQSSTNFRAIVLLTMRRWFALSAFVVVLAIVAAEVDQLNGNATLASICSREESRRVAKFLNSDFLKRMFLKDLQALSISCPLHPSRNIYADQESHKTELRGNDWQVCRDLSFLPSYCTLFMISFCFFSALTAGSGLCPNSTSIGT